LNRRRRFRVDYTVSYIKRSRAVTLGLVPAMASWFAACTATPSHQQLCTDQSGRVVDDDRCDEPRDQSGSVPLYRYYYAPYRAAGYAIGELVRGGSAALPANGRVVVGHVVRGGFGSIAHGVGG
jgi:hypothetical protein